MVLVNINIGTLKNFMYGDKINWRNLGHSVGRDRIVTVKESVVLVDTIIHYDQGNGGNIQAECIELVQ